MIIKGLIIGILIILQASSLNIRSLTDSSDNCNVYGYLDQNGKMHNKDCNGCTKVCKKCDYGYYLDQDYMCQKLPDYCYSVDKNGNCQYCIYGYYLNKDTYMC